MDLMETVHLFLKMLEHYCKKTGLVVQKKVRKKAKSKPKSKSKFIFLLAFARDYVRAYPIFPRRKKRFLRPLVSPVLCLPASHSILPIPTD